MYQVHFVRASPDVLMYDDMYKAEKEKNVSYD